MVCNIVFAFLVKIRVCSKPIRKYDMGSASSSISISLPGSESHDTERRRQKALKALSERLNKAEEGLNESAAAAGGGDQNWPSLDEEDETMATGKGSSAPVEQKLVSVHHGPAEGSSSAAAAETTRPKSEDDPPAEAGGTAEKSTSSV
jgi:hypothetical protein